MHLRRDRTHHTGASNLAFESPASKTSFNTPTKSISLANISKNSADVLSKRVSRNPVTPLMKTQEMYFSAGKLQRSRTEIGYPRLAQLEESEKRKLVFTGESALIYDKKLEKYRDYDYELDGIQDEEDHKKENLIKEKHKMNGTAIQETQLVGYDKYSADTLKNNVDLEKVREAKRVLRRRYATRKNFFTIYKAWDEEHKGSISVENVYNMSKRMGLNLNVDESRVLLASADKTGNGVLTLDEFLDLVYNKDDALNVDLDMLASNPGKDYLIKREELEKGDGNLLRRLEADAKNAREIKHMNQVNLVLKNNVSEIAVSLFEGDTIKAGYVNYEKFEEAIKKLAINESVVSTKDIKTLFEKHKSDAHTLNYKNFVDMLKNFTFQYDEAYKEHETPGNRKNSIAVLPQIKDEFHIVDCRNLPYHGMVTYLGKTRKVNRAIKRFFPNKENFYSYLSEVLKIEQNQVSDKYVSRKELKGLVDGLFSNFDETDVAKKDFEGFLSSFIYNNQGDTNLKEVARVIYDEEEKEFFDKINFKKKGPGPRKEFAENDEIDAMAETCFNFQTERLHGGSPSPTLGKTFAGRGDSENIDRLLQKLDDTFFVGTKRAYEVFRGFDADKDGYISRKDFAKRIQDKAIMSKAEIQAVLDFVDPEKKGYVNFQEFSNKIRPNMAQQDVNGEFKVLPLINPSKEAFEKTVQTLPHTKEKISKLIDLCRPEAYDKKPKTRYGASPCWTNTFLNVQVSSKSPMFISENERFDRTANANIKFQVDENKKKKVFDEARLQAKQRSSQMINDRIERETQSLALLDENRRLKKSMLQTRYEQRAKLLNTYV